MSATETSQTRPHVLIIGTGITGVVLAHGLQQAGIPVSIFEREPAGFQPASNWTMGVHWSAPLLKRLIPPALYERISEAWSDPCCPDPKVFETLSMVQGDTGEVLKDIVAPGMFRADRNRLRKLCSTGLPILHEKSLSSLSYSADGNEVTAHFHDGTMATGNIVVGADGARSVVRRELLGEEKGKLSPTPTVTVLMKVNFNDAEKALYARSVNPTISIAVHPTDGSVIVTSIQDVGDENDPTTWTFVIMGMWKGKVEDYSDNESRLAALKKIGTNFSEPYRSVVSWIPDGTRVTLSTLNYWATIPWDNRDGRVTLMGDAAHPMTPMRGQGLNNCIADVASFVDAMAKLTGREGLPELVAAYEAEMVPRGHSEVMLSVKHTESLYDWNQFLVSNMMTIGLRKISPVPS